MSPKNQKTILPTFEVDASMDDLGVSPMTGLSINLGNTLQIRRNLTFHSNESTPVKSHEQSESVLEPHSRSSETSPAIRSLKNAAQFGRKVLVGCSPTKGVHRRFSFPTRRLNDGDDDDKENNGFADGQKAQSTCKIYQSPNSKVKHVSSRSRPPLEDHDSNSQDSCYSSSSSRFSSDDSSSAPGFRFTEPIRLPLKRINTSDLLSPASKSSFSSPLFSRKRRPKLFHSASNGSEFSDDGFVEHFPVSSGHHFMDQDENAQFPDGFGSLLSGTIVNRLERIKEVSFTESETSACEQSVTPVRSNWKTMMMKSKSMSAPACESSPVSPFFGGLDDRRSGKRTADSCDASSSFLKRRKSEKTSPTTSNILRSKLKMTSERSTLVRQQSVKGTIFDYGFTKTTVKKLQRSFSETEVTIEKALERATSNPNLIGNFTKPLALPIRLDCKHSDLKNITCCTLAKVIKGKYSHSINSYKIIDCRYPYEYEGGHIKDAVNLYTEEQIMGELMGPCLYRPPIDTVPDNKRDILIFHCEFSSKRGPSLLRYLRNIDRSHNTYPSLNYPEIYLLDGGYREFYDKYIDLCEPQAYLPMNSREHRSMYSMFKQRSKSCNNFGETQARNLPKRLGL